MKAKTKTSKGNSQNKKKLASAIRLHSRTSPGVSMTLDMDEYFDAKEAGKRTIKKRRGICKTKPISQQVTPWNKVQARAGRPRTDSWQA